MGIWGITLLLLGEAVVKHRDALLSSCPNYEMKIPMNLPIGPEIFARHDILDEEHQDLFANADLGSVVRNIFGVGTGLKATQTMEGPFVYHPSITDRGCADYSCLFNFKFRNSNDIACFWVDLQRHLCKSNQQFLIFDGFLMAKKWDFRANPRILPKKSHILPKKSHILLKKSHNFGQIPLFGNPYKTRNYPVKTRTNPVKTRKAKVGFAIRIERCFGSNSTATFPIWKSWKW